MACCATMATLRSLLILVFLHQVGKSNANGPCSSKKYNITTLKNDRRNIAYNKTTNLCDRNLIKNGAWYKFESTAGNPQMLPEKNPGTGRCGTYIPIWMNGKHPTVDGVVTNVTACAQLLSVGSTCDTEYNIKVIKCKSFFIYELKPPSQCYLAYCATAATTPGGGRTTLSPATPPTTTATSTMGGNTTTPFPTTPIDSRTSTKKVDTKSDNGILGKLDKEVDNLYRKNISDEVRKKVAREVIDDLLNVTNLDKMDEQQRENGIDPQNITIIARILQQIVHLNVSDNNLNILGPASNILDIRNTKSWRNMTDNKVIRDLVITLEDYGLQYGENLKNSSNTSLIVKDYPNVQLNLRYIKYAGNLSREERIFKFPNASFNLSPDALLKESGAVVVILWYKTIHYLIKNTSSGDNIYAAISSKIITVNVRPERKVKFSEPVRISWDLAELNDFKMCAYWKPRLGENIWKSDGCKRITDKLYSNRLTCECDHLTAFAVMDISRTMLSKDKRKALELISTIGCSVSLVGVILTILIYALFWKRLHSNSKSKVPSQVFMHLCVVIGMTDIFAILAGPALKYKTFCIAVSVLLYFFVLALFGWMLCEGIIIYLQLVKVFSGLGLGGKHLKGFYIIGWGIPVFVVSVLVGVNDPEDFITKGACWCGGDGVLFWVFVGTLGLIILVNVVIFILALRNALSTWASTSTRTQGSETTTKATVCTKLRKAKIGLKGSAVLLPILGLTWVFGLLVFNRDATVFKYLFAIFNSLQGLMIFLFHVLINKKIHEEISRERKARNAGPPTKTKSMPDTAYVSLTNEKTTGKSRIPVPEDIELSQHSDHQKEG